MHTACCAADSGDDGSCSGAWMEGQPSPCSVFGEAQVWLPKHPTVLSPDTTPYVLQLRSELTIIMQVTARVNRVLNRQIHARKHRRLLHGLIRFSVG